MNQMIKTTYLTFMLVAIFMPSRQFAYAAPVPISGTLYYTTFSGGMNVHKVDFSYDGVSEVSYTNNSDIASTPGADGIISAPDGDLLVGGQGGAVYKVNPMDGTFSTVSTPTSAYHLSMRPDFVGFYAAGIPGTPSFVPLPFGTSASAVTITGSTSVLDSIAFDPTFATSGDAYYTSSSPAGFGDFGLINFTSPTTATTTGIASGVPAAHGMVFDPFNGKLMLFGDGHITQYTPAGIGSTLYSDLAVGGVTFDQGAVDGLGHAFVADNGGQIFFIDYAASGMVGSPSFTNLQFLASSLDDIAPLVGPGGQILTLLSAASRLQHSSAGTFDIDMPLTGNSGVEDRCTSNFTAVFTFDGVVTSGEVSVVSGTAVVGSVTPNGNELTAALSNVRNRQVLTLRVSNINSDGLDHGDVPFGFLKGDVIGDRIVDRNDRNQVNSDRHQIVDGGNFRDDLDLSGVINKRDVQGVTKHLGDTLP